MAKLLQFERVNHSTLREQFSNEMCCSVSNLWHLNDKTQWFLRTLPSVVKKEPGEAVDLSVDQRSNPSCGLWPKEGLCENKDGMSYQRIGEEAWSSQNYTEHLLIDSSQWRHLVRMLFGHFTGKVFQVCPTWRRPWDRPRTDNIFWMAWECLSVPTGKVGGGGWGEGGLGYQLRLFL